MTRSDFLAHVGSPADSLDGAKALEAEAFELWKSIKDEFFTAAGKPRAKPPSYAAKQAESACNKLREEARILREKASKQERTIANPWSHIQTWELRSYGLDAVAERVEEAHKRYIADAEAA